MRLQGARVLQELRAGAAFGSLLFSVLEPQGFSVAIPRALQMGPLDGPAAAFPGGPTASHLDCQTEALAAAAEEWGSTNSRWPLLGLGNGCCFRVRGALEFLLASQASQTNPR